MISEQNLNAFIDSIKERAYTIPNGWCFFVTPSMERSIRRLKRIRNLYRAHPLPPRKLRKCHMRKLQQAWRRGETHIDRVEQAEKRREEEVTRV